MARKPGKWVPPDQLQRDLTERKHQVAEQLRETSAAPAEVFGACDPMVEAQLADDVVRVFLRHMNQNEASAPTTPPRPIAENHVDADELRELFVALINTPPVPAPDLLESLPQERLWTLADIASVGSGLARQRATRDLRAAMTELRGWEGINDFVLREITDILGEQRRQGGMPLLLDTLYASARREIERCGRHRD